MVSHAAGARWPVSQGQFQPEIFRKAGYVTTVIAIVPAVRFPVPVDVADGVAVTVAVPGPMPRTSPASETVKTLVLDESKMTSPICDGCSGFDVPSENFKVTASWTTSPTRTVAGPVTSAVTSRLYSPQAVRLANASATRSVPVPLGGGFGVREPVRMLHLATYVRPRGPADFELTHHHSAATLSAAIPSLGPAGTRQGAHKTPGRCALAGLDGDAVRERLSEQISQSIHVFSASMKTA